MKNKTKDVYNQHSIFAIQGGNHILFPFANIQQTWPDPLLWSFLGFFFFQLKLPVKKTNFYFVRWQDLVNSPYAFCLSSHEILHQKKTMPDISLMFAKTEIVQQVLTPNCFMKVMVELGTEKKNQKRQLTF